ncbi:MAG: hypothetical protein AAF442_00570 [Pseudomonadota bacterium]
MPKGATIAMSAKITVGLAESIVDLAHHSAQVAPIIAAQPKTHRIKDITQDPRQTHKTHVLISGQGVGRKNTIKPIS